MNKINEKYNNFNAFKNVSIIRKIYQCCFYLSILIGIFIPIKSSVSQGDFFTDFLIIAAYISSYAVLLVLRALEHLIGRVLYLEQELAAKGVIDRQPQQQNN